MPVRLPGLESSPSMATASLGKRKRIGNGVQLLNSNKRKETLFRKCHELTVKSDSDVSLLCVGPDGEIEAWPNHEKVKAMVTKHREKQAGKKNNGEYSHESESEEKKNSANDSAGKLSAESLMTLLREIDSKLETLGDKIKILSIQTATDFCASLNNSGSFMEVYDWHDPSTNTLESYGQPWVSPVQLFTEESMAVPADKDYSFVNSIGNKSRWFLQNTDNFALNHTWEPGIELLGAQDSNIGALQNYYLGSDHQNHLLGR